MKWDGYGATIRTAEPRFLVECLSDSLGVSPGAGPVVRRYGQTTGFQVGQRFAAWIGIDRASGDLYVEAKGETTPGVVNALREAYPAHSVARGDVAADYAGEGAFSSLQALVRAQKGDRVKGGYVALPDQEEDGKTWAAGVRGGTAYVRIYEPGKMRGREASFSPDAVRVELEARPHYARDKRAAATMQPIDLWGLSAWTQRVGSALIESDIPRFEPVSRKYSFDSTTRYIATAFRRHLTEMLLNGEDIVRTFQAVWEEEDEVALRLHGPRGVFARRFGPDHSEGPK